MRYLIILIAVFCLSGISNTLVAQVNVNVNLGSQPIWGPTGYDYVENYYIPEMDVYYNVPQHRYYYLDRGLWIGRASLPVRYRNHSLFNVYKIVLNDPQPWHHHKIHKEKYYKFKGRHNQMFIRDSRDKKYFIVKGHPQHQNWLKESKQGKPDNRSFKNSKNMQEHHSGMNDGMEMQKQGKGGKGGRGGGKGGGKGKK